MNEVEKPLLKFSSREDYLYFAGRFILGEGGVSKEGIQILVTLNLLVFDGSRYHLLTEEELGL